MTDKIQQLHDNLPAMFDTEVNPNWKALVEAIGQSDQEVANLIEQIRKQFFVSTATRPYLDRLGSKNSVQRPRLVGMGDQSFRQFIPIMSYSPKQVKLVFDKLLDLFFLKEATTAFLQSSANEPYTLESGWTLKYLVDSIYTELITFTANDFTDINKATAVEIASTINRQTKYSYAVPIEDNINKTTFIRIFSKTVGSKGAISITGGLANIALKLGKFNNVAGQGTNTQWTVTKIGSTTTFQYVGGSDPLLSAVVVGDIALINLPGNAGSFRIQAVDNSEQTFTINNNASTPGTFTEVPVLTFTDWSAIATYNIGDVVSNGLGLYVSLVNGNINNSVADTLFWAPTQNQVIKFTGDYTARVYKNRHRAVTWEVSPGEIDVEVPATPPVVRRNRKGAAHINGVVATMVQRIDDTTMSILESVPVASAWNALSTYSRGDVALYNDIYYYSEINLNTGNQPNTSTNWTIDYIGFPVSGGTFFFQPNEETHNEVPAESITLINPNNTRLSSDQTVYTYTSKVGNILSGISPAIPPLASLNKFNMVTANRVNNELTISTASAHNFKVGDTAILENATEAVGIIAINGCHVIKEIIDPTTVLCTSVGDNRAATGGTVRVERPGLAASGSLLILNTSTVQPRTVGPYLWDVNAKYVLSSKTTALAQRIDIGSAQRNILVDPNEIDNAEGALVFSFGTPEEEGPVRYFFKPSSNTLALDPSYIFKYTHEIGSAVTKINRSGGIQFSKTGAERAPYLTDPGVAREVLKGLMEEVKSVGIFLNFIVRYPELYYSVLDPYNSGELPPG